MIKKKTRQQQDTIELLTLLIEKWDEEHNTFSDADPVELLDYLMKENRLKAVDLVKELKVSKSLVSDVLHYRRGLSRDIIRYLTTEVHQEKLLSLSFYFLILIPLAAQKPQTSFLREC